MKRRDKIFVDGPAWDIPESDSERETVFTLMGEKISTPAMHGVFYERERERERWLVKQVR